MSTNFTNTEDSARWIKREASVAALASLSGRLCTLEMGHRWLTAYIWGKLTKLPEPKHSQFESDAITISAKCGALILTIQDLIVRLYASPNIDTFDKFRTAFSYAYSMIGDDVQGDIDALKSFFTDNAADVQLVMDESEGIDDPDSDDGMTLRKIPDYIVTGVAPFKDVTTFDRFIRSSRCIQRVLYHVLNNRQE